MAVLAQFSSSPFAPVATQPPVRIGLRFKGGHGLPTIVSYAKVGATYNWRQRLLSWRCNALPQSTSRTWNVWTYTNKIRMTEGPSGAHYQSACLFGLWSVVLRLAHSP